MKIKSKLLLSFLTIIGLTIVIGTVSYTTISSLSARIIPAIQANDKVSIGMLSLRRNEKDFFARSLQDPSFYQTGTSDYLTKFNGEYSELKKQLEILKNFSKERAFQDDIQRIERLVDTYKSNFYNVVDAKKERGFQDWGKIGQLRQSVHNIESKLSHLGQQKDLIINMLMNRRHEKDYLLRNDLTYRNKLVDRVAEFKQLLNVAEIDEQEKASLSQLITDYQEKFEHLVQMDEKIGRTENDGLTGEYRSSIRKLTPLLEKIEISFNKEMQSEVKTGFIIILTTLALVVLFSLVLVFYLSSIISKPLKQMSEAGKKVASGDLNASMPNVTTKDEVKDIHIAMTSLIGALRYHVNNK